MRNQQQKEITVKTSNGEEFKFGGISENFTRKLFEWEERRNIAPESSTIGETPARKVFQEFGHNMLMTVMTSPDCLKWPETP